MAIEKKTIHETHFVFKNDVGANDKCPPQARVILDAVKNAEGQRLERAALVSLLSDGRLVTRQTPERILGFYKQRMTSAGYLEEEKVSREIEVEVPDKPAKAAKSETSNAAADKTDGAAPASVKSKKGSKVQQEAPAENAAEATA